MKNYNSGGCCLDIDRLISICRATGPTGPTGATGVTGPTGATGPSGGSNLNTYMMAVCTAGATYLTDAPILFNTTTPASNITYSAGTFTLVQTGVYLINWSATIKNEGPNRVLSLGIYKILPSAGYVNRVYSGNTISNNSLVQISGTAIINASSNTTFQLRNSSTNNISTYDAGDAVTITITRIN